MLIFFCRAIVIELSQQVVKLLVENNQHRLDCELTLHMAVVAYDVGVEDLVRKRRCFSHIVKAQR